MKRIDVAHLRKLLATATPPPWFVVEQPWGDGNWVTSKSPDPHGGRAVADCQIVDDWNEGDPDPEEVEQANAALIAAAVSALPALLAVYEASVELRVSDATPTPGESIADLHANAPAAERRTQLALTRWRNAVDAARKAGT